MKPLKPLTKKEKEKLINLAAEMERLKIDYIQIPEGEKIISLMSNSGNWNIIIDYNYNFIDRYRLKDDSINFIEGIRPY